MTKAVFFDIDNTLILFDEQVFFKAYLPKIAKHYESIIPSDLFIKKLLEASSSLHENNGSMTNAAFFMNNFSKGLEIEKPLLWNHFITFYKTEFDQFQSLVIQTEGIQDVFNHLSGKKVVAASNPFWPLKIQEKRLAWAGLASFKFDFITHIENTHFCKPNPEYFLRICKQIQEKPEHCLMVGNDPVNDMIAGKIGMKTYLTTDADQMDSSSTMSKKLRKFHSDKIPKPDYKGPLKKLPSILEKIS